MSKAEPVLGRDGGCEAAPERGTPVARKKFLVSALFEADCSILVVQAAERQAIEKAARRAKQDEQAPAIENIMESLRAMAPRRRRAGQRESDVEPVAVTQSSLSLDLGSETADDTFGSQALSILNTLRQKGFSSSESEPVLPRISRLSASRLSDLSRLEQATYASRADDVSPVEGDASLIEGVRANADGNLPLATDQTPDDPRLTPVAEEPPADPDAATDKPTTKSSDALELPPEELVLSVTAADETKERPTRLAQIDGLATDPVDAQSEPAVVADVADAAPMDRPFSFADLGNFSFEGVDLDTTLQLPSSPLSLQPPFTTTP